MDTTSTIMPGMAFRVSRWGVMTVTMKAQASILMAVIDHITALMRIAMERMSQTLTRMDMMRRSPAEMTVTIQTSIDIQIGRNSKWSRRCV